MAPDSGVPSHVGRVLGPGTLSTSITLPGGLSSVPRGLSSVAGIRSVSFSTPYGFGERGGGRLEERARRVTDVGESTERETEGPPESILSASTRISCVGFRDVLHPHRDVHTCATVLVPSLPSDSVSDVGPSRHYNDRGPSRVPRRDPGLGGLTPDGYPTPRDTTWVSGHDVWKWRRQITHNTLRMSGFVCPCPCLHFSTADPLLSPLEDSSSLDRVPNRFDDPSFGLTSQPQFPNDYSIHLPEERCPGLQLFSTRDEKTHMLR